MRTQDRPWFVFGEGCDIAWSELMNDPHLALHGRFASREMRHVYATGIVQQLNGQSPAWRDVADVAPDKMVLVRLAADKSMPKHAVVGRFESARHAWAIQWDGWRTLPALTEAGEPSVLGWMHLP